jgi:1-deoxy-D-xylulose-5-phosphate synthase
MLEDENLSIAHYDMRFAKPLDTELLDEIAFRFRKILTIEDGIINGGFGSAVLEYYANSGLTMQIVRLGIPDRFIEQGTQQELYHECGFDPEGICKTIRKILSNQH